MIQKYVFTPARITIGKKFDKLLCRTERGKKIFQIETIQLQANEKRAHKLINAIMLNKKRTESFYLSE